MPKLKIDPRISWGNIITIICGFFVVIGWFVAMETANAGRDSKIGVLEEKVTKIESIEKRMQEVQVTVGRVQEKQDLMLQILRDRR